MVEPAASPDVPPSFWALGQGARAPASATILSPNSIGFEPIVDISVVPCWVVIDTMGANAVSTIRRMSAFDFTTVPLWEVMRLRKLPSI